ncbi:MAG: extracellular solute-binding protein [Alphaproteobacteria bacterium]|nr:extracellular solute-binding protein [Alphaproteobacteria bacterium]
MVAGLAATAALAEPPIVHVYNWNDYIADDTLPRFEAASGIKTVYDVYDSNDVLEAKLLAGKSGFDLVFPTARPNAQRQIKAGVFRPLDKAKLANLGNVDPEILASLGDVDPGNRYVVPYMWGTTGLGINVAKVRAALGEAAAGTPSWGLLFEPANAERLAKCGISILDDPNDGLAAMLTWLGRDPNSSQPNDLEAARAAYARIRKHVRYFHASKYINDLAGGHLCVAHGYSGDIIQARERARAAKAPIEIAYLLPREGAVLWTDVMAIPADAPHPDNAHKLIDFLLRPEIVAKVSNAIRYANANAPATALVDAQVRNDPSVYPPSELRGRLFALREMESEERRRLTRLWTRIKSGQ